MPFPETLDAGQLTQIRAASHYATQYIVVNPETVVFAARVQQIDFEDVLTQVFYDTVTTGAFGDVKVGMRLLISRTNDTRAAFFDGRIRAAPDSSTLYFNETSARVQYEDYIFVIKDYPLVEKIPKPSGNTILMDYNVAFRELLPLISGIQSSYVVIGDSNVDLALAPSALATASGAAISSWSWHSDGASFQSGSSSSQNVTLRFALPGVYWPRLTVTDDNGNSNFIAFMVCIVPTTYASVVSLGFEGASITRDLTSGSSGSIVGFDGIDSVRSGARVTIFTVESFGGTSTPIVTNIDFVGYLRTEDITTSSSLQGLDTKTTFQLEGFGIVAGRTFLSSFGFENKAAPAAFGEILNMTPYRVMAFIATELCTLSNVCSISFDAFNNTYLYALEGIENRASILDAMFQDVGQGINARGQFAASGEILIARSARYVADIPAFDTIADFDNRDYIDDGITLNIDPVKQYGRCVAGGAWYNTSTGITQYVGVSAPAVMADQGNEKLELNSQILPADTVGDGTLGARAAYHLKANNPYPRLTVTHTSRMHWLVPMVDRWYTHTITADENNRGMVYDDGDVWLCEEVSLSHNNENGERTVQAVYGLETATTAEYTVNVIKPPGAPATNPQPPAPPFNSFPTDPTLTYPSDNPDPEDTGGGGGGGTPGDTPVPPDDAPPTQNETQGNVLVIGNTDNAYLISNFWKSSVPTSKHIFSGGTNTIQDIQIDLGNRRIWVLVNDGADYSWVYRANNFYAPSWTASQTIDGLYSTLRVVYGGASGRLMIYSGNSDANAWTHTIDLTDTLPTNMTLHSGSQSGSGISGATTGAPASAGGAGALVSGVYRIVYDLDLTDATTVTSLSVTYNRTNPGGCSNPLFGYAYVNDTSVIKNLSGVGNGTGITATYNGDPVVGGILRTIITSHCFSPNSSGTLLATEMTLNGTGVNPFTGSSTTGAYVRVSDDYGATWDAAVLVGDAGNAFDNQKIGNTSFAAGGTKLYKATTFGGSYSEIDDPTPATHTLIYAYGQNTEDLVVEYDQPVLGDRLYKDGSGITPLDTGDDGVIVGGFTMPLLDTDMLYGVFSYSGTWKFSKSDDGGSSWTFPKTLTGTTSGTATRQQSDGQFVYVSDNDVIWGSKDYGDTFVEKTMPAGSISIIRVK